MFCSLLCGLVLGNAYADDDHDKSGDGRLQARITELETLVIYLQRQMKENASNISGNSTAIASNTVGISGNAAAIGGAQNVLQYVHVDDGELNGVTGPHFIIEGANVHVRSGAESTGEGCNSGSAVACPTRTGLGNLIIGYNEPRPVTWDPNGECAIDPDATNPDGVSICTQRNGAHHLVVGQGHNFIGHGGAVMGLTNEAKGSHTTVLGGRFNSATGTYSSVSGGQMNAATSFSSSVSGGWMNRADGPLGSVSGGYLNVASGESSTVSGGNFNIAGGEAATVGGGNGNSAGGPWSTVSGGEANQANTFGAVVSGGRANAAQGAISAVSGGINNVAWGASSSISGGQNKSADDNFCTIGDNDGDC